MALTRTRVTASMGSNTYTTTSNDTDSPIMERDDRSMADMFGLRGASLGRGDSDQDIGYAILKNDSGTPCYVYPNAAGNGIIVQTTRP